MGGGICKTLLRNGADVTVFDINPEAVAKLVALGGEAAASAADAARGMDIVVTSLPLPTDLESVLTGDNGVFAVMAKGSALFDISTVDPASARRFADLAEERGLDYLACPLGKGPAQAEVGEAPIFAGGRREVFAARKPALENMGGPVIYLGDVEQSSAFKLITNLIGMTNVIVMAEGVRLARAVNIEPAVFMDACRETGAMSYQLAVRAPWIFTDDYAPRFAVDLALKDVRLGVDMAGQADVRCPFFTSALQTLATASATGLGGEDCAAVYKLLR
jgi:3-hydroxyisobutyrate dehydrogenase